MRDVVVTGIGALLPGCDSRESLWTHLRNGASQLTLEPDPCMPSEQIAIGRVRHFLPDKYLAHLPRRFYQRYPRELQLYLGSLQLAQTDAQLDLSRVASDRIGLFDGCARPMFEYWYERFKAEGRGDPMEEIYSRVDLMVGIPGQAIGIAASLLEARGPTYTFTGTCSSGAIAIGHAYREIRTGEIDVAFAGGHESCLVPPLFAAYREANLLSPEQTDAKRAVTPYVGYSTNAFAEGAITLVLEARKSAEARGARPIASVVGYKYGNNGYHPTTVDVVGVRPSEVIADALSRARIPTDRVGFVVGHGNAVQLSDVSEENYMRQVFGARAAHVPLISTKPIFGHTLGASSALNVAASALMLQHSFLIPTINIDESRSKRATHHQPNVGATANLEAGVSMSYGIGGHNTAVILRRYDQG